MFLTGPGETIRDKSDVAAYCGEPPAKRHPSLKADPRSFGRGSFRSRSGFRLKAYGAMRLTLKRLKFVGDHTARDHPFPSRTRKLSLAGPMVLHGQPCGRLGDRRQLIQQKAHPERDGLFAFDRNYGQETRNRLGTQRDLIWATRCAGLEGNLFRARVQNLGGGLLGPGPLHSGGGWLVALFQFLPMNKVDLNLLRIAEKDLVAEVVELRHCQEIIETV